MINGATQYLWRAVDHEGEVLEALVTKRRDRMAALKFLGKTMKRPGRPHGFVIDKLRSCGAALKDLGLPDDRETGRSLDNRAENSHQPFRRREGAHHSRDNFKANRAAALKEWRGLCAPRSPTG